VEQLPLWIQILIVFILLCFSAFFSISETSLMSVNRLKIKHLATKNKAARVLEYLLTHIENTLSVILIGNNLLNTLVTVLVTTLAVSAFGDNQWVLSITTALISCLIILFCEIIPKVLGATYSEPIALKISVILRVLGFLLSPLIYLINAFLNQLFKLFNISTEKIDQISVDEMKTMVLENHHLNLQQRLVIHDFLALNEISINEVMTPKSKIEAINLDDDLDDILEQITNSYHSKLLVYQGDLNQLLGILHIRKVIGLLQKKQLEKEMIIEELIAPHYIPENISATQQFENFQKAQKRMGIIVDEYGNVKGLITIEDILEQMIGEFTTSTPKQEILTAQADGSYIINASTPLRDIERQFKIEIEHPAATVNGLLLDELKFIPEYPISFAWQKKIIFEVMQSDDFSIKTVRFYILKTDKIFD
jgi:Mg2+/Co2+ transporter CorB